MSKKTFKLNREITGYSRSYQYIEVEADSLEEAKRIADRTADDSTIEICRDDRERSDWWQQ